MEAAVKGCCHSTLGLEEICQRSHFLGPRPDSGHIVLHCLRLPPRSGMTCLHEVTLGAMFAAVQVTSSSLRSLGFTLAKCVAFLLDKGCSIRRTWVKAGLVLSTVRHCYVRLMGPDTH